jgi:hypothetical protein
MNVNDTIQAAIDGKLDGDGGGKQDERRSVAKEDMRFVRAIIDSGTLERSLRSIGQAGTDMILTEEDAMVVAFIKDRLVALAAMLPNAGTILAIRGNQSGRWR